MTELLKKKLSELPKTPGVYFHKSASGEIIYVGKAAVLRNRVRQYFQASRSRDPKTEALVAEIADTDWMEVNIGKVRSISYSKYLNFLLAIG